MFEIALAALAGYLYGRFGKDAWNKVIGFFKSDKTPE